MIRHDPDVVREENNYKQQDALSCRIGAQSVSNFYFILRYFTVSFSEQSLAYTLLWEKRRPRDAQAAAVASLSLSPRQLLVLGTHTIPGYINNISSGLTALFRRYYSQTLQISQAPERTRHTRN